MEFRAARFSVGQRGAGDDRAAVLGDGERVVLAVADGAGGSAHGAHAAASVIASLDGWLRSGARDAVELLRECDASLAGSRSGGETTAVVVVVDGAGVVGASVGDSEAWLVDDADHVALTEGQARKPLVGSGRARPVAFAAGPLVGTLLLGTDGLFKYCGADRIRAIARGERVEDIPRQLVDGARLPSGALQDDATAVVCRALRVAREDGHG